MANTATRRTELLEALREYAHHDFSMYPDSGHHPSIETILLSLSGDMIEGYAAAWALVSEGVIIPGAGWAYRGKGNDSFKNFPYFSITAHGTEVLT